MVVSERVPRSTAHLDPRQDSHQAARQGARLDTPLDPSLGIVIMASSEWRNELPLNVHYISRHFAASHRLLFVESSGLRAPSASKRDLTKVFRRLRALMNGLRQEGDVFVLSPFAIPGIGHGWVQALNRWILGQTVRRAAGKLGIRRPLLWVFLPTGIGVVGKLEERLLIYHVVDDYAENPGVDRDAVLQMEKELLRRCDLRFATSEPLHEDKTPQRGAAHYLPNVADSERFLRAGDPPAELASVPHPRIGYTGNIAAYKVDIDLLARVAEANRDWQFCLVGPVGAGDTATDIDRLRGLPNVHLFGPKGHEELPDWVTGFDVCMIPFCLNRSTRSSFPLKFFEYMAAGKEIVTTPLPSLRGYANRSELCRQAEGPEAFGAAVAAALKRTQSEDLLQMRREEALQHSWTNRLPEIERILVAALEDSESSSCRV